MNVFEWTQLYCSTYKKPYKAFKELSSTNAYINENYAMVKNFNEPLWVFCENQTEGKGRFNRQWEGTKPGDSLFLSLGFFQTNAPHKFITTLLGLVVYESLCSLKIFDGLSLKAPNDIYIGDSKVGGILCESVLENNGWTITFGIGLNVFSAPSLESQKTGSLGTDITEQQWNLFLRSLEDGVKKIRGLKGEELPHQYTESLERAFQVYYKNEISKVMSNGHLVLNTGKTLSLVGL